MADVLIYLETAHGADGASLKKPAAEVATAGRALADAAGGRLVALITGAVAPEGTLGRHGVDEVLHVDGDAYGYHLLAPQCAALEAAIADVQPGVVLLAATVLAKELAAYAAGRTGRALVSDATAIAADGDVTFVESTLRFRTTGGDDVSVTQVARSRWRDGKIVDERFYHG